MPVWSKLSRIPGFVAFNGTVVRVVSQHPWITIRLRGHRSYVGGLWDSVGRLQFDFLRAQGLEPRHYVLDIGCGSLRAGVHLIQYLEPGHYLGMEKEQLLLDSGIQKELGLNVYREKKPVLIASAAFEFERFGQTPDFALAQSVFTHMTPDVIKDCLRKLRASISPTGAFYATYFEASEAVQNPTKSNDLAGFRYTRAEMLGFGRETGWKAEYIGDWNHPRDQVMVRYLPG